MSAMLLRLYIDIKNNRGWTWWFILVPRGSYFFDDESDGVVRMQILPIGGVRTSSVRARIHGTIMISPPLIITRFVYIFQCTDLISQYRTAIAHQLVSSHQREFSFQALSHLRIVLRTLKVNFDRKLWPGPDACFIRFAFVESCTCVLSHQCSLY